MATEKKPGYKLTYFEGIRARAEATRMMLEMSGADYTDERIPFEEWAKNKERFALGQLPSLETGNGAIVQTTAIANYIAKNLGFLPETDWEKAVCDSMAISMNDLMTMFGWKIYMHTLYKYGTPPSEETLAENMKSCEKSLHQVLDYIQRLAKKDGKFIFGNEMTVADISLFVLVEYCCVAFPETKNYSDWLKQFLKNMNEDVRITTYLENRPASRFGV